MHVGKPFPRRILTMGIANGSLALPRRMNGWWIPFGPVSLLKLLVYSDEKMGSAAKTKGRNGIRHRNEWDPMGSAMFSKEKMGSALFTCILLCSSAKRKKLSGR